MKGKKVGGLDTVELQRQAQDSQEQLFRFRFQMGMGQAEGLKKYRMLRKDRARLLTALRAKELSGEVITPLAVSKPAPLAKKKAPKKGGRFAGLFGRNKKK
jgi:large subunit ribosomal protein L29